MLPDYPVLKSKILEAFYFALEKDARAVAPMSGSIRAQIMHEGLSGKLARSDGSHDDIVLEQFSSEASYSHEEFGQLSLLEAYERLKTVFVDIATQKERYLIEKLSDAVRSVGHDFDAGGRPLSADLLLEALDPLHIDFDRAGKPMWPSFFTSEESGSRFRDAIEELMSPSYRTKLEVFVEKKRREWNDRQSDRKLVD